jgi:hypothetical protein
MFYFEKFKAITTRGLSKSNEWIALLLLLKLLLKYSKSLEQEQQILIF